LAETPPCLIVEIFARVDSSLSVLVSVVEEEFDDELEFLLESTFPEFRS